MEEKCYYCGIHLEDDKILGYPDCPKHHPELLKVWEQGYNDYFAGKSMDEFEDDSVEMVYNNGYSRAYIDHEKVKPK